MVDRLRHDLTCFLLFIVRTYPGHGASQVHPRSPSPAQIDRAGLPLSLIMIGHTALSPEATPQDKHLGTSDITCVQIILFNPHLGETDYISLWEHARCPPVSLN